MPPHCFLYGLTSFSMGLAVLFRGRPNSRLALGQQFYWLAAFGLLSSFYAWGQIFDTALVDQQPAHNAVSLLILLSLAASGAALLRFGLGLFVDAGPLPPWLVFFPVVGIVSLGLIVTYAILVILSAPAVDTAIVEWSRYLLLLPGSVLAAMGFMRQWQRQRHQNPEQAPLLLLATAIAFLINAVFVGGITELVNVSDAQLIASTGMSLSLWRVTSMSLVAVCVIGSMNVFELERQQEMNRLNVERRDAQRRAVTIHAKVRQEEVVWLDALVQIGQRIANMDETDIVLDTVVTLARNLAHADSAVLALLEQSGELHCKFHVAKTGRSTSGCGIVESPAVRKAVREGRALRVPEDASIDSFYALGHETTACVGAIVPLKLNGTCIGALWTARAAIDEPFTCTDLIGLGHLADQAVIALEHASMTAKLQSLAVVEERNRIAREMHDGLAQILGYLSLETQTIEALVRRGDDDAVLKELKVAREAIKSAHADVRENILSLRTTLAGDLSLTQALRQYVEEFGIQTGIETVWRDIGVDCSLLSPIEQAQCVRIVQEALTNVRKHADAASVTVEVSSDERWFEISIADDGVGLPLHTQSSRHFGLQTMRERAESVGGSFRLVSHPGEGTTISLRLPLLSKVIEERQYASPEGIGR